MNLIEKLRNRHKQKQQEELEKIKLMQEIEEARKLKQERIKNEKKYEEDILHDLLNPSLLEGAHFVEEKKEIEYVD